MTNIKSKLSTAVISDTLDEMGYTNQMLSIEIKPNFKEAKIFGPVRIMTIKILNKNESYLDVYKGLYFLESLNKGEVLIVSNPLDSSAFFGELMSTLAKYKGLDGVLIDGCTRDKLETIKMHYPVFSKKNIARDIRKRGIVDKVDAKKVIITGVNIRRGDYLFGDLDGVIIIPKKIKDMVIKKAIIKINLELKIKRELRRGLPVKKIIKKFGKF